MFQPNMSIITIPKTTTPEEDLYNLILELELDTPSDEAKTSLTAHYGADVIATKGWDWALRNYTAEYLRATAGWEKEALGPWTLMFKSGGYNVVQATDKAEALKVGGERYPYEIVNVRKGDMDTEPLFGLFD